MKRVLALGLIAAACVMAQSKTIYFYDSGSRMKYVCENSHDPAGTQTTTWQRSDSTLTSIAITSNLATFTTASSHQAYPGMRVVVAGSTAAVIDGTVTVAEVLTATTFTATLTAANGTYTTSTIVATTTDPLLTATVWSIDVYVYSAAGVLGGSFKAGDGKSLAYTMKCSDRALY